VTAPKLAPGVIDTPILVDNAVTNPKLADMAQATVKGRAAGAGTGDPQDLTQAQLVGVLNTAAVTLTNPLTVNLTTAGSAFNLTSTDAGPGEGPTVTFIRDSASPAANDLLSVLRWYGRDSAANLQEYGNFYGQIINPTSGAETSHFSLTTMAAGVYSSQMVWDNGVGFGGYGAVGGGTINGGGYYVNSTKLADGAGFNMAWIAPGSITGSMIADRTITDADIALASVWGSNVLMDNSVGMEKLTDMPNATVKMRPAGYGAGDPLDINQTDALVNMANNAVGMDIQWYHRPIWHQQDGAAISNPTGGYGAAQIQSAGVGPAAMLAFHRVGSFAAYFGLETDNTWRVGGWSYGNVSYCVFHQGFQASKADMEARSADYFGFSPARAIWHDGVSKSWVLCNTAGGVGAPTHGVGSMTDGGDGYMALNFMYGMVSPYPACQITCLDNYVSTVRASAISQYTIQAQNYNLQFSTVMDPTSYYMFTVHGQIQ
jgi:hypothetical protein